MPSGKFATRLRAMVESSFPKECANCGRVYENLEQYFRETKSLNGPDQSGQSYGDEGFPIVVVSRNCTCGSTLMKVFDDRRDQTEEGRRKRVEFNELLGLLVASGLDEGLARAELRKAVRGEGSDIILERLQRTRLDA